MKRMLLVAFGATLLALGAFRIASAHASLDHCTPAVGSTAVRAPAQIVCVYSEEIDTKRSTMSVWNANGDEVDRKDAHVDLNDANHATLIVSLDPALAVDGLYTVKWHAVTPDDNGVSDGAWQFVVGSANATPYPPTEVVQGETPGAAAPATAAPATAAPAASPIPTAPAAAPAVGGAAIGPWIWIVLLGAAAVLGGVLFMRLRG